MRFTEYIQGFTPDRHTILGVELQPLSLGKFFLMRRLGVGYATDTSANVGWDDLVVSLLICSMSYEDFTNFMDNKTPDGRPGKCRWLFWKDDPKYFLHELLRNGKLLRRRIKKEKNFSIFDKMVSFNQYMSEGTKMPKYWNSEEESTGKSGAHWSQILFTTAIGELGYTRSQALNTPLVQMFNDFFRYLESQGALELMTEEEEALVENMEGEKPTMKKDLIVENPVLEKEIVYG